MCYDSSLGRRQEASFLKKRSKKLLFEWNALAASALQLTKFFCFFLFTKRRLILAFNISMSLIIFPNAALDQRALADASSRNNSA